MDAEHPAPPTGRSDGRVGRHLCRPTRRLPAGSISRRAAVLTALLPVAGLVLAGCARVVDEAGSAGRDAGPDAVAVYVAVDRDEGHELEQVSAAVPEGLAGDAASDAERAVAALLALEPTGEGRFNLWHGDCAPGEEVTDVAVTRRQVTVRLDGWNGATCDIEQEALDARDQQLVWTVLVNSKATIGAPPFPPVVVHDGSGLTWSPIRADGSFLPAGSTD